MIGFKDFDDIPFPCVCLHPISSVLLIISDSINAHIYAYKWLYEPVDNLELTNEWEETSNIYFILRLTLFTCINFPANDVISHFLVFLRPLGGLWTIPGCWHCFGSFSPLMLSLPCNHSSSLSLPRSLLFLSSSCFSSPSPCILPSILSLILNPTWVKTVGHTLLLLTSLLLFFCRLYFMLNYRVVL